MEARRAISGERARRARHLLTAVASYEEKLDSDSRWALTEGSKFFEETGAVHDALRRIAQRLDELGIPYAVSGGLALFIHGFRRFTEDVDILVTGEGLKKIHAELDGLGYVPPFRGSKNLRDTKAGVKIEFLITGQFPGDGKPKAVSFPDPAAVAHESGGIKYLRLSTLVELKLASGMTNPQRMKDLSDVGELIKLLNLPKNFAEQLSPFVQPEYMEIWNSIAGVPKRYVTLWRNKFLTIDANNLNEMIERLRGAVQTLEAMRADGVTLDPQGGAADDYAHLVTTDPEVAKKYDMHDESEFWGEKESEDEGEDEESGSANS